MVTVSPWHWAAFGGFGGFLMVVVSESRLLLGVGSATSLVTEAVSVSEPLAFFTVTLIVIVRSVVVVTVPRLQISLPLLRAQVPPPVAVAETRVTPPGRPSVTTVLVAGSGPALWTRTV